MSTDPTPPLDIASLRISAAPARTEIPSPVGDPSEVALWASGSKVARASSEWIIAFGRLPWTKRHRLLVAFGSLEATRKHICARQLADLRSSVNSQEQLVQWTKQVLSNKPGTEQLLTKGASGRGFDWMQCSSSFTGQGYVVRPRPKSVWRSCDALFLSIGNNVTV